MARLNEKEIEFLTSVGLGTDFDTLKIDYPPFVDFENKKILVTLSREKKIAVSFDGKIEPPFRDLEKGRKYTLEELGIKGEKNEHR